MTAAHLSLRVKISEIPELLKLVGRVQVNPIILSDFDILPGDVVQIDCIRNKKRATAIVESSLPEDSGQDTIRIGIDSYFRLNPLMGDKINIKKINVQPADHVEFGTIHPQLLIKPEQRFSEWKFLGKRVRDIMFPSSQDWTIHYDPYLIDDTYSSNRGIQPPSHLERRAIAQGDTILLKIASHWFEFRVLRHKPESEAVFLEPPTSIYFKPQLPLPEEQSAMSQLAEIPNVDIPLVTDWEWFPSSNLTFIPLSQHKGYPIRAGFSLQNGRVCRLNYDKILQGKGEDFKNDSHLTKFNNISYFSFIRHLSLSGNQLSFFPTFIKNLKHLEVLHLVENCLTSLPDEICTLSSLKELGFSRNKLNSLPDSIGNLKSLLSLDLSDNEIQHLPEKICDLFSLQVLKLDGNPIEFLPDHIGQLKSLKYLSFSRNTHLKVIPEGFTHLNSLKELNISGVPATIIQETTKKFIENLRNQGCVIKGYVNT